MDPRLLFAAATGVLGLFIVYLVAGATFCIGLFFCLWASNLADSVLREYAYRRWWAQQNNARRRRGLPELPFPD